ncbi:MAG: hypothetical protein JNJ57_13900, partial [Saprospiraceae bacterium]|nr:hypothetical protein [Saprospiraceae bacterium]
GIWTQTSTNPSTGFNANTGSFQTTGQQAGVYTFQYQLTAAAPCPNDAETVTVILNPLPVADAGEDQAINCDFATVTLGGPATTPGNFVWTLDGTPVGATQQIIVDEAGIYTLTVTTLAGCSASDETNVVLDNVPPVAEAISVNSIRCFGDEDGVISIDSITAAHPPVLYSIDGGVTYQASPVFQGLRAGTYTVILLDQNGCETTTPILNVIEPPLLTANLGADVEAELSDSVHLSVQTSLPLSALDTVLWSPLLDSTLNRVITQQNFLPLKSWRILVTVIDTNGCEAVDEVVVRLEKPRNIYVPNVFNPTSNIDPILYIFGGRDVAEIESFHIFDRWGTMLFEQTFFQPNDPVHGWDGKFKGESLSPAVFVYQAKVRFIDGVIILFKGDVTLVR